MEKGTKKEKARKLFLTGMKLVDIAKTLNVPQGTVRRWKSEGKWSNERTSEHTNEQNTEPNKKEKQKRKSRGHPSDATGQQLEEKNQEDENSDSLNEREEIFCIEYLRCFNATKAYQRAYQTASYATACTNGWRKLQKAKIKERIEELRKLKSQELSIKPEDIFQKYMDIAFADMTEYLEFDQNGVWLKNSKGVDGSLVVEVRQGKDGVTFKLPDRLKALQWLTDHLGMATEEQKAKLELIHAQTSKLAEGDADEEDQIIIVNDWEREDAESCENIGTCDSEV